MHPPLKVYLVKILLFGNSFNLYIFLNLFTGCEVLLHLRLAVVLCEVKLLNVEKSHLKTGFRQDFGSLESIMKMNTY